MVGRLLRLHFTANPGTEEQLLRQQIPNGLRLQLGKFLDNLLRSEIHDLIHDQDLFRLDADDLDNKHRITLHAIIKIMLQRPEHNISSFGNFSVPGYIKVSTDDGDGDAKLDVFDVFGEADSGGLNFFEGKVRFHR